MYNYLYDPQLRSGNTPNSKYTNKTVLNAIFLFGKEVPPNKRKEIKERYSLDSRTIKDESGILRKDLSSLNRYLQKNEGAKLSRREVPVGREYFRRRTTFTITPLLFRLGFKLREEATGQLPLDEMIDLKALNHFVLTGETNYREKQEQEKKVS